MKERPILFSAPMILAILNGSKTQTRRVAKMTDAGHVKEPGGHRRWHTADFDARLACPYGQPGDRLWVRESHWWFKDECDPVTGYYPPKLTAEDVLYRADGDDGRRVWRPSIHMPRWASRITLEITGVRVERLQDISEADAIAEGTPAGFWEYDHGEGTETAKESYECLWESINGPESWHANPLVWVVEFKRVKGGAA